MAFNDRFRMSSHAVIVNELGQVLQLKATYGQQSWGLPGGALELGETIHQALHRECREELGVDVEVQHLSGVYYHAAYESQAFIFRCTLSKNAVIALSAEHSEYRYFELEDLSTVQRQRVEDCLQYQGVVTSGKF
ncbi:NUDIX hydrolase [Shewanella waksmanii]|uniref:NUDIX hydrolase n=1 Tax=Shewanella waksmanii TaxID=213783 RepID=UPI0037355614